MVGRMVAPEIASCRKSPGGGESWRVLHRPDRFLRCGYVSGAVGFGHSIPPSCAKNEIWRQPYRFRFAEQRTVWGRHSSARFHEGQNEQMAKFGPMVEYCSTLPSRFHFSKFSCFFDAGNRLLCVILIRYTKKETKRADYIKHQESAGAWLSLQSGVLVIGSEKSKSGSASYSSRRQNQRRGGAVRYFQSTDTVSG